MPRKRSSVGKQGIYGSEPANVPPEFGRRSHKLTHAQARRMRQAYIKKFATRTGALTIGAYGRKIFETILAQEDCRGIRFYPGLDPKGKVTVMFCGVDSRGDDILAGTIGDVPFRCPTMCSSPNGVLQFD